MDELKSTHYDAFISYRHSELDSFVASNLHKRLESFKLPKSAASKVKNGRTRIERVFRDVDELPLSDNLSEPITNALANSDYLITICTPRYPQSKWCLREIDTFLKTHPRDHILVVLAEGEPVESFPQLLTYDQVKVTDENGVVRFERKEIEPLAADTRGNDKKEILKAMDIAVLKLCAAMFGLNFDDLKQRHREAKMRKAMTVLGVIGAFLLLFALVVTGMLIKISGQNRIISSQYSELRDKYAETIADKAAELYGSGRRMDAIYALRSVLPDETGEKVNANALRELYSYLGVYGSSTDYAPGNVYDMDSEVYDYCVSENGEYILVNDLLCMRLFDRSGNLIKQFENTDTEFFTEGILCGSAAVVYTNGSELKCYSIEDGEDITITELPSYCNFYGTGEGVSLVCSGTEIISVDESGNVLYRIDAEDVFGASDISICDVDSADGYFACSFSSFSDHYLMVADVITGKVTDALSLKSDINIPVCIGNECLYYSLTEFGDDIAGDKCTVRAMRLNSGREVFSVVTEGGVVNDLSENNGYLYVSAASGFEVYDASNGKKRTAFTPDDEIICGIGSSEGMIFVSSSGKVYKTYEEMFYEVTDTFIPKERSGKIARIEQSAGSYYILFERADYISSYHAVTISDVGEDSGEEYEIPYGEDATSDLEDDENFNSLLLDQAVYSGDKKYIVASFSNHVVRIYKADTYECVASYDMDEYVFSLVYSDVTNSYILGCEENSHVLDEDFRIICDQGIVVGEKNGNLIIEDDMGGRHPVEWIDYNGIISMADEYLGDHEPRENIREKYGI